MQYPCTLKNIFYSNEPVLPPSCHLRTNPTYGNVLIHFIDKTLALVVTVEIVKEVVGPVTVESLDDDEGEELGDNEDKNCEENEIIE